MARIRTIKPEFWGDEKLAPLAPLERLVFLGLISIADDAGRIIDNVKSIDGFLFPHTEDSSRDSLDTLATTGRISRYIAASGQRIIQIVNWQRHQKVDKPSKHVLPGPSRDSRETVEDSSRSDLGPRSMDLGPEDQLPTTAAARDEEQKNIADAKAEFIAKAGDSDLVRRTLDDFVAASPTANRLAWSRGLVAMLEPLGGRRVAVDALLLAMQDFLVADRERYPFVGRVFRAFVDEAGVPRRSRTVPSPRAESGSAALMFGRITNLIQQRQQPGQAAIRYIPRKEVEALGTDVLEAYNAIGGADRILGASGDQMGFVIRDFTAALEAAHHV